MLNEIVEDAAQFSGYDIIVDDGGHKSSQMLTSFRVSHPPAQAAQQALLTAHSTPGELKPQLRTVLLTQHCLAACCVI